MSKKRDKFVEVYFQYYPVVFSAVNMKVDNFDDVEDICQEVFIRFYNKMEEIQNVKKWLYGALKLVVLEYYRRKTKSFVDIDDVFNDVSITFVNGFRDTRIIVQEAIEKIEDQLNDEERAIFEFVAVLNYSYGETARHIGMTKRQIEYKYRRIADRITEYLKDKGIKNLDELL